jgi:hypothetical protein
MAQLSSNPPWIRPSWLAWMLLVWFGSVHGQPAPLPLERQVMAAYIYKFAGFVEWPEASFGQAGSALEIGVAGSDALAEQLERIVAARSVNGHPLKVRRVQPGDSLDGLHILFASASLERAAMATLLGAAQGHSLLTVCDGDTATSASCMIQFVIADDKLRFDVALRNVAPSRLRISARMLAVAHRVRSAS